MMPLMRGPLRPTARQGKIVRPTIPTRPALAMPFFRGNRRRLAGVAVLLIAGAVLFAAARHYYPPGRFDAGRLAHYYAALQPFPAVRVDPADVERAARAAARYIRQASDASGQFTYVVNTDPALPVVRDYSILRHQGTVYALGMYDDLYPDLENVAVMRRAVEFMRRCCYVSLEDDRVIGIREPDFVANQRSREYYKLGGAGLGLLALVSAGRKLPGFVSSEELMRVAALGHLLQKWNGSFYALYSPGDGGPTAPEKSLYYPGEMAKGWVALYELRGDDARDEFDAAVKALTYLARSRARAGSAPADHWALLATDRLLQAADERGIKVPRDQLVGHALQVCDAMLEEARRPQPIPQMQGSLAPMGAVTPTATRLEGLQAALRFLPPQHPIVPHIRAAVEQGLDFLLRAQVAEGPYAGGMPQAIARLPDDGTAATRRFNAQATEIRIDYVQHSLSAMVQYLMMHRAKE
jgi:hypothetical protein